MSIYDSLDRYDSDDVYDLMPNLVYHWQTGKRGPRSLRPPGGAPQGSIFKRRDGGAGTSFYVKETGGISNTGWVGK